MSYRNIFNGKLQWSEITMQSANYFIATLRVVLYYGKNSKYQG